MELGIAWLTVTDTCAVPLRGIIPLSVAVMVNVYTTGLGMDVFATNISPNVTVCETEVTDIPKGVFGSIVKLRSRFLPTSRS